jgi:hypothetical protein
MKMNRLYKFALLLPAFVGGSLLLMAAPPDPAPKAAVVFQDENVVAVDKVSHDFGIITEEGGAQTATFLVTNRTDAPILLTNVRASCGCTATDWTKTPIEPGKTGTVSAAYNPKGRPGPFDKTVTIYTSGTPERIIVHIMGTVQ